MKQKQGQEQKQKTNTNQIISKVQIITDDDKEIKIGKIIQTLFQYTFFYAPILETYSIKISSTKDKQYQNKKSQYASNQLRYVGNININLFIQQQITIIKKRNTIFETHLHILKGLQKFIDDLNDPIIHNNVQNKNILMDQIYDVPILINFRSAITMNEFQQTLLQFPEKMETMFFSHKSHINKQNTIEFTILSYIIKDILGNQSKHMNIHIDKVEKYLQSILLLVETFVEMNFSLIEKNKDKLTFINDMNNYIHTFQTRTIYDFICDLFKNWKSWDNYSTAIMFYEILSDNFDKNDLKQDKYLDKYKNVLESILLTTSDKIRMFPTDTYQSILFITKY